MAAETDLERVKHLARSLGYDDPTELIESVAWVAQYAPLQGERIVEFYEHALGEGKTELAFPEDAELRAAEMYVLDANLRFMHSAGDLLAQAVNVSLNLGVAPCSLVSVRNRLEETADGARVAERLRQFEDNDEWRYLQSFVNTNKHRFAVLPDKYSFHWHRDEGFKQGWVLPAFDYTPLGKNKTTIENKEFYRSELAALRDRQVQRIYDVFREVLVTLETRTEAPTR